VVVAFPFSLPAAGQTLCTEPVPPSCVEDAMNYTDDLSRRRCERNVQDFDKKIVEFETCMQHSVTKAKTKRDKVQARHDCLAEGKENCPSVGR